MLFHRTLLLPVRRLRKKVAMTHSEMMGDGQVGQKGTVFYDQRYRLSIWAMANLSCSQSQDVCSDVEMRALWTFTGGRRVKFGGGSFNNRHDRVLTVYG